MVSPLHLVFLISHTCENPKKTMRIGGAERQLTGLLPHYERKVEKVSLVTRYTTFKPSSPTTSIHQAISTKQGTVCRIWNHILERNIFIAGQLAHVAFIFFSMLALHKKKRIDILNIHSITPVYIPIMFLSKIFSIPCFFKMTVSPDTWYGSDDATFVSSFDKQLYKLFLSMKIRNFTIPDYIQVLNPIIKKIVVHNMHFPERRVIVLSNGIECDNYSALRGKQPGKNVFGFVGRLEPIKNLERLLDAFKQLSTNHDIQLILIGDGSVRNSLEHRVIEYGIQDRVSFSGFLNDPTDIYSKFDFFVLPSFSEGMSNSLLEAMAVGLPVLVSRVPGNTYIVHDGVDGIVFNPNDTQDLSAKMELLLIRPDDARKFGENARNKILQGYSLERVSQLNVKMMAHRVVEGRT